MGFTTGFLSGLTFTTTVVYLTMAAHRANRYQQALALRQQSLVLNSLVEPLTPAPPPVEREIRAGLAETIKDRWNKEVEQGWHRLLITDWAAQRDKLEDVATSLWRKAADTIKDKSK